MLIGYTRVSTEDQNLERQDLGDVDRLFSEKLSGGSRERPALQEMLRFARNGDTVRVHSIDRLARNVRDLADVVNELVDHGVTVEFTSERLTFRKDNDNPMDNLTLHILGAFAEFERSMIRKRQAEGIAKAKERGAYKGRKAALTEDMINIAKQRRESGVPLARIARELKVARTTLYSAMAGTGTYAKEV